MAMATATVVQKLGELPLPPHFDPKKVGEIYHVPYETREAEALAWAKKHGFKPGPSDRVRICLMPIDTQITFCVPGWADLFVGGRSGTGAVDDNVRLCEFIYKNLHRITRVCPTMDTHLASQIFFKKFWINDRGEHPASYSTITEDDVRIGRWRVNPAVVSYVAKDATYAEVQRYALHYVTQLKASKRYDLSIWPYHGMLGGVGHALAPAIDEAVFFLNIARKEYTHHEIKGGNPLSENYSVFRTEVLIGPMGEPVGHRNTAFLKRLLSYDAVLIAGQAKSHCVAWTIDDLLSDIAAQDPDLAKKVYLLEDCTSPVVVPGVVDFTDKANADFDRFVKAGMHVVKSTDPMESWPGLKLA